MHNFMREPLSKWLKSMYYLYILIMFSNLFKVVSSPAGPSPVVMGSQGQSPASMMHSPMMPSQQSVMGPNSQGPAYPVGMPMSQHPMMGPQWGYAMHSHGKSQC